MCDLLWFMCIETINTTDNAKLATKQAAAHGQAAAASAAAEAEQERVGTLERALQTLEAARAAEVCVDDWLIDDPSRAIDD